MKKVVQAELGYPVLELRQRGFPPRERIRMLSLYGVTQPSQSVWKRVKSSHMEVI
jgi:hypothetical protein